jgi:hypothetical protein
MMGHCGVVSRHRRSVSSSDKNTAPDDFSRLGDTADRAAAKPEVHEGLAKGFRPGIPAYVVRGRCAAGDEENPHIVRGRAAPVPITPAKIVQGVLDRLAQRGVHAVGEDTVQAGAFINLIEVGERLAGADDFTARICDRRPVGVVE